MEAGKPCHRFRTSSWSIRYSAELCNKDCTVVPSRLPKRCFTTGWTEENDFL